MSKRNENIQITGIKSFLGGSSGGIVLFFFFVEWNHICKKEAHKSVTAGRKWPRKNFFSVTEELVNLWYTFLWWLAVWDSEQMKEMQRVIFGNLTLFQRRKATEWAKTECEYVSLNWFSARLWFFSHKNTCSLPALGQTHREYLCSWHTMRQESSRPACQLAHCRLPSSVPVWNLPVWALQRQRPRLSNVWPRFDLESSPDSL